MSQNINEYSRIQRTVRYLLDNSKIRPRVGFVLGSGLSFFGSQVRVESRFDFGSIPGFCPATVEGHPGQLLLGHVGEVEVAVLQGRLHAYEGHSFHDVVLPVRALAAMGVKVLMLTNASGGLMATMRPGDFMIIKDHINLTGDNPLRGRNIEEMGPRFVDMTDPYDRVLRAQLKRILKKMRVRHHEGTYCGVLGPSYETAAEIQYLRKIGGHAVGMSTVAETLAARHAGLKVAGLSCITNLGTGLSKAKLDHQDVSQTAGRVQEKFAAILREFTVAMGSLSLGPSSIGPASQ